MRHLPEIVELSSTNTVPLMLFESSRLTVSFREISGLDFGFIFLRWLKLAHAYIQ